MINFNNSYVLDRYISLFLNKDKKGYSIHRVQKGVRKAKTKYCCTVRRLAVGSLYNTGPVPKISLRKMWIRHVLLK